jgi:hypothetical protein
MALDLGGRLAIVRLIMRLRGRAISTEFTAGELSYERSSKPSRVFGGHGCGEEDGERGSIMGL